MLDIFLSLCCDKSSKPESDTIVAGSSSRMQKQANKLEIIFGKHIL